MATNRERTTDPLLDVGVLAPLCMSHVPIRELIISDIHSYDRTPYVRINLFIVATCQVTIILLHEDSMGLSGYGYNVCF